MSVAGGNAAAAARLARMDRSYLLSLLRKLQIRGGGQGRGAPANGVYENEPSALSDTVPPCAVAVGLPIVDCSVPTVLP